jgi:parvulin-like peptidyl-prolyl isomerase
MPVGHSTAVGSAVVKRLLALLIAAALIAGACGTSSDDAFSVEEIMVDLGAAPVGEDGTVDPEAEAEGSGEEITIPAASVDRDEVDTQLDELADSEEFVEYVEATGGAVTTESGLDPDYVAQYISDRIVFAIIGSEVDRRNLEVTDEDRDTGRTELEARLGSQPDPSLPEGEQGPTGAEVLEFMPESYRNFLISSFAEVSVLQADLAAESEPVEDEIRAVYDADPTQFVQACGAHILIAVNDDPAAGEIVTPEQAEAGAELVISALDGGADFAELAMEVSDDPGSGAQGGDLGCAPRGAYVPPFEEALFGAEPGEIVGPVITDFGAHVMRLDEIQEPTYEEARDQILQQLTGGVDPFSAFIELVLRAAIVTVDERYGTWNADEGRVVPPEGPSQTTTSLPGLPELEQIPVPDAEG